MSFIFGTCPIIDNFAPGHSNVPYLVNFQISLEIYFYYCLMVLNYNFISDYPFVFSYFLVINNLNVMWKLAKQES